MERLFTPVERSTIGEGHGMLTLLGSTTLDVYLNDRAFWCNVPLPVWHYRLVEYQSGVEEGTLLSGAGGVEAWAAG